MKKGFSYYAICWAAVLALYCAVVFAVRPAFGFVIAYDGRFWVAFGATLAALVGQLACAWIAFRAENKEKRFLNLPLITESYAGAIVMAVCGGVCMLIPDCPAWITVIVCAAVLVFGVVSVVAAKAAAEKVYDTGEKVKAKAAFMRALTVEAEGLIARARTPEGKAEAKRVWEAIRYSDPMSAPELEGDEAAIGEKLGVFAEILLSGTGEEARGAADELVTLIKVRNSKCRGLKG